MRCHTFRSEFREQDWERMLIFRRRTSGETDKAICSGNCHWKLLYRFWSVERSIQGNGSLEIKVVSQKDCSWTRTLLLETAVKILLKLFKGVSIVKNALKVHQAQQSKGSRKGLTAWMSARLIAAKLIFWIILWKSFFSMILLASKSRLVIVAPGEGAMWLLADECATSWESEVDDEEVFFFPVPWTLKESSMTLIQPRCFVNTPY